MPPSFFDSRVTVPFFMLRAYRGILSALCRYILSLLAAHIGANNPYLVKIPERVLLIVPFKALNSWHISFSESENIQVGDTLNNFVIIKLGNMLCTCCTLGTGLST